MATADLNANVPEAIIQFPKRSTLDIPDEQTRLEYLRKTFAEGLKFYTDGMDDLVVAIDQAAGQKGHILILGETGTGKELTAQALRTLMDTEDAMRPFKAINCASIPDTLVQSELFGHEKGAFTSADRRRIGLFEQVNGGRLFLDEIGKLSKESQFNLLRVLETGTFQRLGGNEELSVDVQVIAATSAPLHTMSTEELESVLMPELYYRLSASRILLQRLCERPLEARMNIIEGCIQEAHKDSRRAPPDVVFKILDQDKERLAQLPYKGNVRELKTLIRDIYTEAEYEFTAQNMPVPSYFIARTEHVEKVIARRGMHNTRDQKHSIASVAKQETPVTDIDLRANALMELAILHRPLTVRALCTYCHWSERTTINALKALGRQIGVASTPAVILQHILQNPKAVTEQYAQFLETTKSLA